MGQRVSPDIKEAQEYLKDGYIDIGLWRRRLAEDKVYYQGELHKCRQSLKEIQAEIDRLTEAYNDSEGNENNTEFAPPGP